MKDQNAAQEGADRARVGSITRETGETRVSVRIDIDGAGRAEIDTPLGFMNHMLSQIARHGMIDLSVKASGDIETGSHHTAEDTSEADIVLGAQVLAGTVERLLRAE